jgi:glyoxylate/hydroxypyruvate reductase A
LSILFAASGWNPSPWRARLERILPGRPVAALGEPFDRASIRYALSWRHPPGALADLPNLRIIFSLGAGVDHLFADPGLPETPTVRVVDPDLRDRMSEWAVMQTDDAEEGSVETSASVTQGGPALDPAPSSSIL